MTVIYCNEQGILIRRYGSPYLCPLFSLILTVNPGLITVNLRKKPDSSVTTIAHTKITTPSVNRQDMLSQAFSGTSTIHRMRYSL